MRFSAATATVALAYTAGVLAETHNITVGQGGLTFAPSNITAAEGDIVSFQFAGGNHSVTQSTFPDPCTKKADALDSGFRLVNDNAAPETLSYEFTVNGTDALWFFCAQTTPGDHCKAGMVFSVNAPADKTFEAFQSKAKEVGSTGSANNTSASGSPTASGPAASQTGGAMSMSASAVSLLSVAGLALGLAI
ncbi:hypothetical protein VNI00_003108 [Paramarasmius palmivorus]|uniref:Cupredoxin n=1 Tax=Paramarasmius palmivorus TaxID=297713 RepID=A0AAW0DUC4_9AGAR